MKTFEPTSICDMMIFCIKCLLCISVIFTKQGSCEQRFVVEPQDMYAVEGSNIVLQCTISNKVGKVQWTRRGDISALLGTNRDLESFPRYTMIGQDSFRVGTETHSEYNLQIQDVNLKDDAEFQCQVGHTDTIQGGRTRYARVSVLVPPDQPYVKEGTIIAVTLGVPINITCYANRGKPAAEITWYNNGIRMTGSRYTSTSPYPDGKRVNTTSMITITATKDDAGNRIECRAKNEALVEPFRTDGFLDVQYPPEITMSMNVSRIIREFDFVRITCSGIGNPAPTVWSWFRNGDPVLGHHTNILDIAQIGRSYHENTIACVGNNTAGTSRKETVLTVEYGPLFLDKPHHVAATKGDDEAILECQAEGNPQPSIFWNKKGSPLSDPLSTSPTLRISPVSHGKFGIYECTAKVLNFNPIKREVYLLENGPPKIMSDAKQYGIKGDERTIVECLSWSVPKPPEPIRWLRGDKEIDFTSPSRLSATESNLPYGRKSILQIIDIQEGDFGAYNCNVINQYGEAMALINLIEKDILPLAYIIGGIVGGLAVVFVIVLACVLYHRNKGGDNESYTDTESTSDKKRDKSDSPSDFKSTLMDEWRQGYNKEFYRYSEDYDDVAYKEQKNNNGFGHAQEKPPYSVDTYPQTNGHVVVDGDYGHRTEDMVPPERFENSYSTGYVPSSFRTDYSNENTLTRLPPADLESKLSTNV